MDSIPKILISFFTIVISILICILFIVSATVVNSARTYHSSVIDQIEASDFNVTSLGHFETAAENSFYDVKIEETSTPESDPYSFYKVTLKYGLALPIIGNVHIGELVGYASPGAFVNIRVPGLYETGTNYTKLLIPWDKLVEDGVVSLSEDGVVTSGYSSSTGENSSSDILDGDLMLPFDGSVKEIAETGFFVCNNLTGVMIPDSTTTIGDSAFAGCNDLTTVDMGSGVKYVYDDAFNYSGSIGIVNYTGTVDEWCRITFLDWQANPLYYGADLIINGTAIEEVTIPSDVTTIENVLIGCTSIKKVTIPSDSVLTKINQYSFRRCENLEYVTIEAPIEAIEDYAFLECYNLKEITIPETVTSISTTAFRGCTGLNKIVVEEGNTVYHDIDDQFLVETASNSLLIGCVTSDNTVIPEGIEKIVEYAFSGNPRLVNLTLPSTLTVFSVNSFSNCPNIESLTVASGNTVYHSQDNCVVQTETKMLALGCKNSVIPDDGSVMSIGRYSFGYCYELSDIVIPSGVTTIMNDAFAYCYSLEKVEIPSTVTTIGSSAFTNCSSLTNILYDGSMEQWEAIDFGSYWDSQTGEYTVHCSDGDIAKE